MNCSVITCIFHTNFHKNLQNSIQITEAPKGNADVHFSLMVTGHVLHSSTLRGSFLIMAVIKNLFVTIVCKEEL